MGFVGDVFDAAGDVIGGAGDFLGSALDKIIPNEIKPALPFIAAAFPFIAPGVYASMASGLGGFMGISNPILQNALMGGVTNLVTQASQEGFDKRGLNPMSLGLGALGGALTAPGAGESLRGGQILGVDELGQAVTRSQAMPYLQSNYPGLDFSTSNLTGQGAQYGLPVTEAPTSFLDSLQNAITQTAASGADIAQAGQEGFKTDGLFNKDFLKAVAPGQIAAASDLAYNYAKDQQLAYQDQLDKLKGQQQAYKQEQIDGIRKAMVSAGFTEAEIQDALKRSGFADGGRAGYAFGGFTQRMQRPNMPIGGFGGRPGMQQPGVQSGRQPGVQPLPSPGFTPIGVFDKPLGPPINISSFNSTPGGVRGGMGTLPNAFGPMQQPVGDPRTGAAFIPGNPMQEMMRGPQQAPLQQQFSYGGRAGYGMGGDVIKGMRRMKGKVSDYLSKLTDDIKIYPQTDYATDVGASFDLTIVPKTKKGKSTLDKLVDQGYVDKHSDGSYFMSDSNLEEGTILLNDYGVKASGVYEPSTKGKDVFESFRSGAGLSEYASPYYGYDRLRYGLYNSPRRPPMSGAADLDTIPTPPEKFANGGLMSLGGHEMDFRDGGGFVPIGRKERADDVPARLSKNEFVFTADAVRNAGGGDIKEGARRMYQIMKQLEAKA